MTEIPIETYELQEALHSVYVAEKKANRGYSYSKMWISISTYFDELSAEERQQLPDNIRPVKNIEIPGDDRFRQFILKEQTIDVPGFQWAAYVWLRDGESIYSRLVSSGARINRIFDFMADFLNPSQYITEYIGDKPFNEVYEGKRKTHPSLTYNLQLSDTENRLVYNVKFIQRNDGGNYLTYSGKAMLTESTSIVFMLRNEERNETRILISSAMNDDVYAGKGQVTVFTCSALEDVNYIDSSVNTLDLVDAFAEKTSLSNSANLLKFLAKP